MVILFLDFLTLIVASFYITFVKHKLTTTAVLFIDGMQPQAMCTQPAPHLISTSYVLLHTWRRRPPAYAASSCCSACGVSFSHLSSASHKSWYTCHGWSGCSASVG